MQKGILETNDHLRATFDLHSSFPSFLSYTPIFKDQFYVLILNNFSNAFDHILHEVIFHLRTARNFASKKASSKIARKKPSNKSIYKFRFFHRRKTISIRLSILWSSIIRNALLKHYGYACSVLKKTGI